MAQAPQPADGAPGEGFPRLAKLLHWSTALGVIALVGLGWVMVDLPLSPLKLELYTYHKEIGVVVFLLTLIRLGQWLVYRRPAPLSSHAPWERTLAKIVHVALYGSLLSLPILGWIGSSAAGFSVSLFGLVTLPDLVAADPALKDSLIAAHFWLGWVLLGSLALHIGGALKHHIIDKDQTLRRMLPIGGPKAKDTASTSPQETVS